MNNKNCKNVIEEYQSQCYTFLLFNFITPMNLRIHKH